MENRRLYLCVGCREVHFDNDYNAKDGDLIIHDWDKFLQSVNRLKDLVENSKGKGGRE